MSTSESDNKEPIHNDPPNIILVSDTEGDVKAIHENQSKKASFFIGDADTRPTKIVGPDDEEIPIEEIIIAPDGGWGWVIVLASFLSNMVVDGTVFSFAVLVEPIGEASKNTISIASIAWIGSLSAGFYFLAGPMVSVLANRYGFRVVAIFGSLLASVGILLAWFFCRDGPVLGALLGFYGVVGGIGFGMIYVPAVIAVGFYFEKKRALATGIAICGSGIGTMIFPPLLDWIMKKYKWRAVLFFQAMIILVCGLFALLYKPLKPTKVVRRDGRRKSMASSLASPDGTPLLMRIKKARDLEKWDSINSFASNEAIHDGPLDAKAKAEKLYNRARKTSTHSLGGGGSNVALSQQRMSVPALLASGDLNSTQQQQPGYLIPGVPQRGKSFVLPDLKEIAEEDHTSDDGSRETSQAPPTDNQEVIKATMDGNENTNMRNRNNSIVVTKLGNSMLTVNDMTQSRILRVASKVTLNQPLYRDDIFYSGSMLRLPEYANVMTSVEWTAAVTTAPTGIPQDDLENSSRGLNILQKMLDVSLLVSPTFLLLSISGFFTMLGIFVPFMYLPAIALESVPGLDPKLATILISVIGIANTTGRIVSGWVADRPSVNVLLINNIALTIIGVATALVPLLKSYAQYSIFACVFGLCMACFASLRSIMLVELLGLEKLTNAFGLMMVFQGIASFLGTPLAGSLRLLTGSYLIPFIAAGGFLALSGVMCYPLSHVKKWETRRNERKKRKSTKA